MSHRIAAKITGVAGFLPPRVMTNADLEKIVDTNDEWVRTRTGIRERHVVDKGMATSHMATEAANLLLAVIASVFGIAVVVTAQISNLVLGEGEWSLSVAEFSYSTRKGV